MDQSTTDAVILAAGRGLRLGAPVPKQFLAISGGTIVGRALDAFLGHPQIRRVVVAIGPEDEADFAAASGTAGARVTTVIGGDTRQSSVKSALAAMAEDPPHNVLIHDAARPFVSASVIDRVVAKLAATDAVIPAIPVADTLKAVADGVIANTVPREGLMQAQTPQGFRFATLLEAHQAMAHLATDDAGVMEAYGRKVSVVDGERGNYKITTAEDLLAARGGGYTVTGTGFDVHRLVPGGPLIIGGLTIPSETRMDGHSDADVALHALTDALFGAIGDGDIGHHFPPTDPQWKGASSDRFLAFATERVQAVGAIVHLDLTIICERPKISPHRSAMRARIAEIIHVDPAIVSVKATTTERLGFTGRGEGIAAQAAATVLLQRPAGTHV